MAANGSTRGLSGSAEAPVLPGGLLDLCWPHGTSDEWLNCRLTSECINNYKSTKLHILSQVLLFVFVVVVVVAVDTSLCALAR